MSHQNGLALPERLTLDAILLWIPLTEATLVCVLLGGVRNLSRSGWQPARLLRAILIPIAITLTACLLLAVIAGWIFRTHGFPLPRPSLMSAAMVDLGSLAANVTSKEVLYVAWTMGISVLVASVLFRLTPDMAGAQWRRFSALAILDCLVLGLLVRVVPTSFSQHQSQHIEAILTADFLPTSSLLWANLLLPNHPRDLRVSEALEPRKPYTAQERPGKHPNIILISVESLRTDEESQMVDGEYVMPTLHRLAKEGVSFRRAYAPSNESAYSLSAILTSTHALKTSVRDDFQKPAAPYIRMYDLLPETYATGFFSADAEAWQNMKAVSWSPRLDRFFDASDATAGALDIPESDGAFAKFLRKREQKGIIDDGYVTRAFEDWVDHLGPPASAKPFFAMLKLESSHFPYQQGLHVPVRFAPADLSPAESRSLAFFFYPPWLTTRMQHRYWNSLSYQDGLVCNLLDHLRSRKALEDTVVIVFGDHGEMFNENGAVTHADRLLEGTLRTAFVMWGAKDFVSPAEYTEPVSLLDIGPIVLRLAGAAPYDGFQGQVPADLAPGGASKKTGPRPIFSVIQNLRFEESVLVGPWRYVLQSDGLYETLHNVLRDPFEEHDEVQTRPDVEECLYATLLEFRRNQLGYYHRPDLVQSFFPPRHGLADIPACETLRQGNP